MTHQPKSARMLSVRKVGRDMLIVRITLRYAHSTEVKSYSVLEERDRRLGRVRYTFARHDGKRNVYHVEYAPGADQTTCTCEGHRRGGWCCHGDALRVLFHRGDLQGHDPSF